MSGDETDNSGLSGIRDGIQTVALLTIAVMLAVIALVRMPEAETASEERHAQELEVAWYAACHSNYILLLDFVEAQFEIFALEPIPEPLQDAINMTIQDFRAALGDCFDEFEERFGFERTSAG
ncbi:MAG: hypothetical protein AAF081_08565 [Actinomycetota bacterium]